MNKTKDHAYSTLIQEFKLLINEPLKKYTSFKIGGPADLIALPNDKDQLIRLITKAYNMDIPISIFGGGTNLLISDKGIRGLVIFTRHLKSGIRFKHLNPKQTLVFADAGERMASVCRFALDNCLSGIEFAAGIPGTLGGAMMMNAGTPDGQLSDIVASIEILNKKTLTIETLEKQNIDFSYRNLELNSIILGTSLLLRQADPVDVKSVFQTNLEKKQKTQPISAASAGCYFKNPDQGPPAGKLIEDAGLKGKKINDVMVSKVHANYIVNTHQATCKDVLLLQEFIQNEIFKKYQIKLETEVRVEGEK
ncbi:MAG: UDP-N-acetylmuramate dehydrogenase [Desulfobacula sp.]|nr:UDP-N-acetylmuramate dehydrogenase [Desulfobacula sp.]